MSIMLDLEPGRRMVFGALALALLWFTPLSTAVLIWFGALLYWRLMPACQARMT